MKKSLDVVTILRNEQKTGNKIQIKELFVQEVQFPSHFSEKNTKENKKIGRKLVIISCW